MKKGRSTQKDDRGKVKKKKGTRIGTTYRGGPPNNRKVKKESSRNDPWRDGEEIPKNPRNKKKRQEAVIPEVNPLREG